MNDLGTHVLLFAVISLAIVLVSAMYTQAEDRPALASVPRRFMVFAVGCGLLTGVLLAVEHLFAGVH